MEAFKLFLLLLLQCPGWTLDLEQQHSLTSCSEHFVLQELVSGFLSGSVWVFNVWSFDQMLNFFACVFLCVVGFSVGHIGCTCSVGQVMVINLAIVQILLLISWSYRCSF